jgi:hypothetical protein
VIGILFRAKRNDKKENIKTRPNKMLEKSFSVSNLRRKPMLWQSLFVSHARGRARDTASMCSNTTLQWVDASLSNNEHASLCPSSPSAK